MAQNDTRQEETYHNPRPLPDDPYPRPLPDDPRPHPNDPRPLPDVWSVADQEEEEDLEDEEENGQDTQPRRG